MCQVCIHETAAAVTVIAMGWRLYAARLIALISRLFNL